MASLIETVGRARQGALLGTGFFILVLIAAAVLWLVQQSTLDAQQVERTLTVQDQLSNVLLSLRRAEAGQRGYLFTNQKSYLEDYNTAQPEADRILKQLQGVHADNLNRTVTIERIKALVVAKFGEMDRTIYLNDAGQREEARALVLAGTGRDLMTELRTIIEKAIADEGAVLANRAETTSRNNTLLLVLTSLGAVAIVLIGAMSVYLVQRNARQREIAQSELAAINSNLERIVEFRTSDLKEANEEIQRFAYIVTHDLRSPLVNVMGFTAELEDLRRDLFEQVTALREQLSQLQAKADSEEAAGRSIDQLGHDFDEAIDFIKSSIGKMDRLINAVLKLSREGRREFHPEMLDMNDMIDSVVRSVAHRAAEQKATIAFADLPQVESDRLAVEQIFSNLVDNALKYGRDDEPGRIEVAGRVTATQAIYEVRDNGRGIEPRDHQRVFELFRRSGPQDRPGEGIGLAHVRALVRRLGGHLSLTSEIGKGSVFAVTLPRRWSSDNRSAA